MTYKEMIDLRNKHLKERGNPLKDYESAMRKVKNDLHEYLVKSVSLSKKDKEALECDPSYVSQAVNRVDGDTRDIIRCIETSPVKFLLEHKDDLKLLDILEPVLSDAAKGILKLYHKVDDLTLALNQAKADLAKSKESATATPSVSKVDDEKK